MGKTGLFDLEKHFAFYGAYHSNPINIAIHMLFVWPILFTILLILYFTPSLFSFGFPLFGSHVVLVFNIGLLLTLIYSVFYVCLDAKAGSLAALLCFICWFASCFLATQLGFSISWKVISRVILSFCRNIWSGFRLFCEIIYCFWTFSLNFSHLSEWVFSCKWYWCYLYV